MTLQPPDLHPGIRITTAIAVGSLYPLGALSWWAIAQFERMGGSRRLLAHLIRVKQELGTKSW